MGKRRNVWLLTGGIGSGKSTIRKMLSERGALTIDADQVGHQVLEPGGAAHDAVAARWPEVVFEGIIDRKRLADIVFHDSAELHALESISHPAISDTLRKWVKDSDAEVIVVEMSVPRDFLGVGPARTIVADVDMATRKRRLVDKGMPLDDVNRRMANQPDRNGWIERGGWVICTDGTLEDVEGRVDRLWPQIESLS
ncbi:MAG TPA: dephospho-CoA kinase [Acidimicrobiia bacterium]|jgi:dephospho-CoA kinase